MTYTPDQYEVDWQKLVLNLRSKKPLVWLSEDLGLNPDYLGRISRAEIAEPRFSVGMALLDLHVDLCGTEATKKLKQWSRCSN